MTERVSFELLHINLAGKVTRTCLKQLFHFFPCIDKRWVLVGGRDVTYNSTYNQRYSKHILSSRCLELTRLRYERLWPVHQVQIYIFQTKACKRFFECLTYSSMVRIPA